MRPSSKSTTRSLVRKVLLWAIWLMVALALAIALAAAWAWSNRYDLLERQAITYLDSLGIEADLNIRSATSTQADIRNIRLAYHGDPFLRIDRLQAAYQWRDLLSGQVERLDFSGLDARIKIDETGQIVDGWRPPSSGGSGSAFPERGIGLTDAKITLDTPYGEINLRADGEIADPATFALEGSILPTELSRDAARIELDGPVQISREGGPIRVVLPETRLSLDHPAGRLGETLLSLDGTYDLQSQAVDGTATLRGGDFESRVGVAAEIDTVSVTGRWADTRLNTALDLQLAQLQMTNADRRDALAKTLSLSQALAEVPVAQNFAPGLVAPLRDLLSGTTLSAQADLIVSSQTRRLSLRGPALLETASTRAVLSPIEGEPFYSYTSGSGAYDMAMLASLSRPVPLTLSPLALKVRSSDGFAVDGVAAASGTVLTDTNWRARTAAGRAARLGPLDVAFDYTAPETEASRLNLRGAANYDGDIPGGYVTALRAAGTLEAQFSDARTQVDFAPIRTLRFETLETTSDWTVETFEGQLQPRTPLYVRQSGRPARVRTALQNAAFRASRPALEGADAATLDMQIGRADLDGRIGETRQDWTVGFSELALQSETFPVQGTNLALPEGELTVGLSNDARSTFAMRAPSSTFITPGYTVRGMALDAEGTAERYELSYDGGRVRMTPQTEETVEIPVLPVSGTLLFENGGFTGQAQTTLPRVPDSPIDVTYFFNDGVGQADVSIRDLRFRPRGLQPQDLAPALRGKIAEVDGSIDARLDIRFGADTPLSGSGVVVINDVSLGTAPGPITGLSGQVELTSLFPILTAPDQILQIATFNPGFPLENGTVTYALIADGVEISSALFPLGEGQVSFAPFTWTYGAPENRVVLRVTGVEVAEFLNDVGEGRLEISGVLEGNIPVVVRGIDVLVENGRLEVRDGGVIQFRDETLAETLDNPNAAMAIKALRNFDYDSLFLEIDGPLDGEVLLGVEFTGSNEEVLFGVPFQFDVTVEGELFNIARSLNPNGLQERLLMNVVEQAEDAADETP